ncbi:hypothetical protein KEM48_013899 [Puccinia striiformis f. sp. tritici PST-130]|nr:hypothetical protein H4Q26_015338 [Puccinia striiformis f. sp. tritici PST-130]KAI9630513.1 hypothetical protein KEM48_013899 [Puccinia striiformis f. sp. tritici PST-130]
MPKPRDGGAPETQLSNVLDHSSFFGPLDMSNQLLVEPLQGNQADLLYNPFPDQLSNVHGTLPGMEMSNSLHGIGNQQQSYGSIQQPAPLAHFAFEEPLPASVEDINSCWQKLNWNRN